MKRNFKFNLIFVVVVFSFFLNIVSANTIDNNIEKKADILMIGPTTAVDMTPPTALPPTKEEVNELIANAQKQLYKKNHKSWWQKIVDFIRSLF